MFKPACTAKIPVHEIVVVEKDAEVLRSLSGINKLAGKCEYVCTFYERFIICHEFHGGKYIYYAVDRVNGKFSRVMECSFKLNVTAVARDFTPKLIRSVWYTGVFNRPLIKATPGF